MRLEFLGADSRDEDCPTLYRTGRVVDIPEKLLRFAHKGGPVTRILTKEQFAQQFLDFEHTTWKLETRDRYNVSGEREEFEYWLRTGDTSLEEKHARTSTWHRNVRDARKAGKLWQRVRVVSEPLSDYIRWEHAATRFNEESGEDIRWLPRHHPSVERLPQRDFWLFDSRWVCVLHFDDDDVPYEYEVIDDPAIVAQHCQWRDIAWHHAIPHREYDPTTRKRFTA